MKSLFLEPFSGLSGDMLNGLLLDLGGDLNKLLIELKKLPIDGFTIQAQRIAKSCIYGTDFDVLLQHGKKDYGIKHSLSPHHENEHHETKEHAHHHSHSRNLKDIYTLIEKSDLSNFVKMFSMTLQKLKLLFINKQLTLFIFMKSEQLIQLLTSLAFLSYGNS